MKFEGRSYPDT